MEVISLGWKLTTLVEGQLCGQPFLAHPANAPGCDEFFYNPVSHGLRRFINCAMGQVGHLAMIL